MRVAGLLFGADGAGSFVTSGVRGLQNAAKDFGCALELSFCDSNDSEDRAHALNTIATSQPNLIVVHGGQGVAPLTRIAPSWPDQRFALTQGFHAAANVACYEVLLEEPAFLAGAFAAWSSQTGIIGHLSGERVGPGLKGEAAFRAGALAALPDVSVLSHFCGHQHDAALAHEAVLEHAKKGADIVFTMLGEGRIGAGIDWCELRPDVFIASVFADSAWCSYRAVENAAQGRFAPMQSERIGLESPEVCRLITRFDTPAWIHDSLASISVPRTG
jgi:basic membrane protein A and related proteins